MDRPLFRERERLRVQPAGTPRWVVLAGGYWLPLGGQAQTCVHGGVVVTGAGETPVHILIHDDEVRLLPADDLWG